MKTVIDTRTREFARNEFAISGAELVTLACLVAVARVDPNPWIGAERVMEMVAKHANVELGARWSFTALRRRGLADRTHTSHGRYVWRATPRGVRLLSDIASARAA